MEYSINILGDQQKFNPGDKIIGNIVVNCHVPTKLNGIYIGCIGFAKCRWETTSGTGSNSQTYYQNGYEVLFQYQSPVFGGTDEQIHPQGLKSYQFTVHLPENLPNTFYGMYGKIRYKLIGQINKSGQKYKKSKSFKIFNIVDINKPRYLREHNSEVNVTVGCFPCFPNGNVNFTASIKRVGYCPGEKILINAKVENQTTRILNFLKVKLYQTITYKSSTSLATQSEHYIIARIDGPNIPKNEFALWDEESLKIPRKTVPTLKSNLIKVSYYLQLQVGVTCSSNPTIAIPITIGTVPLRQIQQPGRMPATITTATRNPVFAEGQDQNIESNFISEEPPSFNSVLNEEPPPSYESLGFNRNGIISENEESDDPIENE